MSGRLWAKALMVGLLSWSVSASLAQNAPAAQQQQSGDDNSRGAAGYNAIVDNLDLLIDNYARFLAKRYDLTPEQDEYTKQMLREQAYKFIEKHDTDLRQVVERMFDVRSGGQMTPQELMEWGKKAQPLYEEAKQLIINGNNDWRGILTDEQKKVHDEDLRQMNDQFSQTDDQVKRIVEGKMTIDEFRNPNRKAPAPRNPRGQAGRPVKVGAQNPAGGTPPADPNGNHGGGAPVQPPGTAQPGGGAPSMLPVSAGRQKPASSAPAVAESEWEKYVREFIDRFKLDEDQQQRANLILKECQEQADTYRSSKKSEIETIDKKIAEINQSKDKDKPKQLAEANKQRDKLMEPVNRIFERLKSKLDQIPTRAQRKAAEEAKPTPKPGANPPAAGGKTPPVKTGTQNHPKPKPPATKPAEEGQEQPAAQPEQGADGQEQDGDGSR